MKISYHKLLNPSYFLGGVFSLQVLFWFFFFPDVPSVPDGNARYSGYTAIFTYLTMFFMLLLGMFIGKKASRTVTKSRFYISEDYVSTCAKAMFWVAIIASLAKFKGVLITPSILLTILETSGVNKLHSFFSESAPGISTLTLFWVFSAPVFGILYFDPDKKRSKGVSKYFWATIVLVLFSSIFNMSRTAFIVLLFMYFSSFLIARKPVVKLKKLLVLFLFLLFFYWINSVARTGLLYSEINDVSVFSLEVQRVLFNEFIEKYVAGELNNTLIIMDHVTSPSVNFAYGTILHQFTEPFVPDYYLNTQNILGFWYWQFGFLFGALVSFLMGGLFGWVNGNISYGSINGNVSFANFHYVMLYAGFVNATRINFFFLHYYVVFCLLSIFVFVMYKILKR